MKTGFRSSNSLRVKQRDREKIESPFSLLFKRPDTGALFTRREGYPSTHTFVLIFFVVFTRRPGLPG